MVEAWAVMRAVMSAVVRTLSGEVGEVMRTMEVEGVRPWWRSWVSTANWEGLAGLVGGGGGGSCYVVTGEGFALEEDLVPAVDIGVVKGRHEEVEVGRQGLHDGHLGRGGAYDGGDQLGGARVHVQPSREGGSLKRLEVALYTLGGPCAQILADASGCPLGLETERVATEVDAAAVGILDIAVAITGITVGGSGGYGILC